MDERSSLAPPSPGAGDEDWLTRLLGRFDAGWLVAWDGLAADAGTRAGLQRISAGDVVTQIDRLLDLYRSERSTFVGIARSRLGAFADEAEDVVQEVMRKLCEHPPALREADKLTAYVHTAIRNETATWGGRASKERSHRAPAARDAAAEVDRLASVPDPSPGLDDVVVFHMTITRALSTLSPRERQLIVLVDIQRLTVREAAEQMGITIGTAKSYHHAARTRLRGNSDLSNLRTAA